MNAKPRFIQQETFLALLSELPRRRGGGTYGDEHGDATTVYRDLSNFVVALLARTPRHRIAEMFTSLQLGGSNQALEWQRAAQLWCSRHKPELLEGIEAEHE